MKKAISATVTPFAEDNRVDLESAARVYEFGLERGIDGFFIFGNMGEWAFLSDDDRMALSQVACDVIGDRAQILLGVSDHGLPGILRNAEKLSRFSHDSYSVLLPDGVGDPVAFLHQVADAADRPIYYYHIAAALTTAQFAEILSHPKIAGLKNSSGSLRVRKELLFLKKTMDFELLEGEEWAIDEACWLGCDGAIAGFGATGAKLIKAITSAVDAGDWAKASSLQKTLIEVFHLIYGVGARYACIRQKYALVKLGLLSSERCRAETQQYLSDACKAEVEQGLEIYRDYLI